MLLKELYRLLSEPLAARKTAPTVAASPTFAASPTVSPKSDVKSRIEAARSNFYLEEIIRGALEVVKRLIFELILVSDLVKPKVGISCLNYFKTRMFYLFTVPWIYSDILALKWKHFPSTVTY